MSVPASQWSLERRTEEWILSYYPEVISKLGHSEELLLNYSNFLSTGVSVGLVVLVIDKLKTVT